MRWLFRVPCLITTVAHILNCTETPIRKKFKIKCKKELFNENSNEYSSMKKGEKRYQKKITTQKKNGNEWVILVSGRKGHKYIGVSSPTYYFAINIRVTKFQSILVLYLLCSELWMFCSKEECWKKSLMNLRR